MEKSMKEYLYEHSKFAGDKEVFSDSVCKWLEDKSNEIYETQKCIRYAINIGGRKGDEAFPAIVYFKHHFEDKSKERFAADGKSLFEKKILPTLEDSTNPIAKRLLDACLDAKFNWDEETKGCKTQVAAIIDRVKSIMYFLHIYYGVIYVATVVENKRNMLVTGDVIYMWELLDRHTLVESEFRENNGVVFIAPYGSSFKLSTDKKGIGRHRAEGREIIANSNIESEIKKKKIKEAEGKLFYKKMYG